MLVGPSDKLLRWLDVCIRSAVRRWLRPQKDTPNAYFYAHDQDGGLRIQSLRYSVPLMRKQRLKKLVTSQDPAVTAIRGTERHMKILRRSGKIPMIGQASATSKVAQRIAWRSLLILSVDGRGLASHPEVPRMHNWVTSGSAVMTRNRAVRAFFRLEGNQFMANVGSCWGSGGGAPGKIFWASCPVFFWKLPSVNVEK